MLLFLLVQHLINFEINFLFFLNSIFLSLGILFICEPLGNLNLEVLFSIIFITISMIFVIFFSDESFFKYFIPFYLFQAGFDIFPVSCFIIIRGQVCLLVGYLFLIMSWECMRSFKFTIPC